MLALFFWMLLSSPSGQPSERRIETKYLDLKLSASRTDVGPGSRLSLFVDVVPKPKIHVYAPGQEDYMPISLTLEPGKGYEPAGAAKYPRPEVYGFNPPDER